MKVALASDHAGFDLKEIIKTELKTAGHEVLDLGTHTRDPVDYPDSAAAVYEALSARKAERAILVCGSGVGVTVAANKYPGVRAGLCHDHYSAHQGVEHDDMNVLCLGARIIGQMPAIEIAFSFLKAHFTKEERHMRRLNKVLAVEDRFMKGK